MERPRQLVRGAPGPFAATVSRPRTRNEEPDAVGTRHHVSTSGDDRNSGTTPESAWRTLARANRHRFGPGDQLLLEGGRQFAGPLCLGADSASTPERPIVIGSYGPGRATIRAASGSGILIRNLAGFRISDLAVVGERRGSEADHGVAIQNDLPGDVRLAFVRIEHVEVSGFPGDGIALGGLAGKSGFRDVLIEHVSVHDNARNGINVHGEWDPDSREYSNENVVLRFVAAHDNSGIEGPHLKHTGSGIILSDVSHGLVEHSVASNNGWLSSSLEGGPIGIWVHDSNDVTIQHNESCGNRTGGSRDGGGFDLDGGVTSSVVQHNHSHDNDGAGYLLAQYDTARPFGGNVVRQNVSRNDGRKNGYGAVHAFGDVRDTDVLENTIHLDPAASGQPAGIVVTAGAGAGIRLRGNVVRTAPGVSCVRVSSPAHGLQLVGNHYDSGGAPPIIEWESVRYSTVEAFRSATGQERLAEVEP